MERMTSVQPDAYNEKNRDGDTYSCRYCCRFTTVLAFLAMLLTFSPCLAITVNSVSTLANAVAAANSGGDKTILVAAGTYNLNGVYLRITGTNITVAGATGDRGDVILDGGYKTTEIFQIVASNTTIENMTIKRAYYHPIHIFPVDGDLTGTKINNVHIIDPGQQAIKINQDSAQRYSTIAGLISNSLIELTDTGRSQVWAINGSCYTGGVDAHHAMNWTVRDNVIKTFWCADGLSEHGIHFWSSSADTVVERNTLVNCDRGIGFGLGSSGHVRGIIRNNFLFHDVGHSYSDVGISMENAQGARVYNNTIYHMHSYANAIEYRFSGTNSGIIVNNLVNKAIQARDGGSADLSHNVTNAQFTWFTDPVNGNLHLNNPVKGVVDAGRTLSDLSDDFDREKRPQGTGIDIGADELPSQANGSRRVLPWLLLLTN